MIIILSPSKTLDYTSPVTTELHSVPEFMRESKELIKILKRYTAHELSDVMHISENLALLNASRYKNFATPFTPANARQALFAFKGDVYEPIEVESFQANHIEFSQKHVRILSGLYGVLKALDLIQPYRLEMGTKLINSRGKDLYAYWGNKICIVLNKALSAHSDKCIINLASQEYFKALQPENFPNQLDGQCINIIFKDNHKGKLSVIGIYAKKARGLMANFVIKNQITNKNDLKKFAAGGYHYQRVLSDESNWVFTR